MYYPFLAHPAWLAQCYQHSQLTQFFEVYPDNSYLISLYYEGREESLFYKILSKNCKCLLFLFQVNENSTLSFQVEMAENTITKAMTSYHVPEDVLLCSSGAITSETETKSRVNSWMSLQESTTRYEGLRYDGANHCAFFFNSLKSLICTIHRNVIFFSVCVWFG